MSFRILRRREKMAIVNRGPRGPVWQMMQYLQDQVPRATAAQLITLSGALVEQLRDGGRARHVVNTLMTFGREMGMTAQDASRWAGRMSEQVVEYAGELAEMTGFNDSLEEIDDDSMPDLGDLIPENTDSNAQVGNRRNRDGEMTDQGNRGQDVDMGEGETQQARAGGGGGPSSVSKETPISSYPSLSYGLPETHTTILPWTGWLAGTGIDKTTPLQLKIRMNTPWDMLDVTLGTIGITDGAKASATKQWIRRMLDNDNRITVANSTRFPQEMPNDSTYAGERPAWRDYWASLYDYYTVLGCEYEIILYNAQQVPQLKVALLPGKTINETPDANDATYPAVASLVHCGMHNTDLVCAVQMDTYSDTATSTGNVMPLTNYAEARAFKNIRWYPIEGGKKQVIRGRYTPGQAKRNIVNDGDVKTWTATGTTLPNLKEILTLNFWQDPFYNAKENNTFDTASTYTPSTSGATMYGSIGMEVNIKYIVQFKDLKLQGRYPNSVITDQDITLVLNESNTNANGLQRWA